MARKKTSKKQKKTTAKATGSTPKTTKRSTKKKTAAKKSTRSTKPRAQRSTEGTAKRTKTSKASAAKKSSTRSARATTMKNTRQSSRKEAKQDGVQTRPTVATAQVNGNNNGHVNGNGQQLSVEELRKVKTGLTKRDIQKFEKLLLEKRAELVGDVESLQIDARNGGGSISYEHMADVGTDSYEQEFTLGLVESERKLLREIDEALTRIHDGTYGACIESGQPIGKPRLEAKPWARYCIEVARDREKRGL